MKYSFQTPPPFKVNVVIDRSLFSGKVKVYADGQVVRPSHHGTRGAAGTFYQIKGGVLEVRSGLLDVVPMVWYNEDWVQLAPPMKSWEWLVAGLPLLPGVFFLGLDSFFVSFIALFLNLVIIRSPQPIGVRVASCVAVLVVSIAAILALRLGLGMLLGRG
ncbi:MAG: hypothetical protein RMN25_01920 [Anaerolineae bacterium]|nr:hypothetical protein [Thermoflexales bacterium]MDW8406512.1 hypothetical protein [Anaerolineae bacterium]